MREKIIEVLKQSEPIFYDPIKLNDMIGLKTVEEYKVLCETLDILVDEAILYKSKKDKYSLFENSHLLKGTIMINKAGNGFVTTTLKKDTLVRYENLNGALNGDTVVVELLKNETEGVIVRVIKRNTKVFVGTFFKKDEKHYVRALNKKGIDILIPEDKTKGAVDGHIVVVKPSDDVNEKKYVGEVTEIVCHKDDVVRDANDDIGMNIILYENGFNPKFSELCEDEATKLNVPITEKDIVGRKDLRDKIIYTIDGADTKDIDDAVSYEQLQNGNSLVGVHIADVSKYVKEGSIIDQEAYERGTSVYLTDRSVPMLPRSLSNGICSLNPETDRLAVSCLMEIDHRGEVVDFELCESVIRSRIKMTYDKVNDILDNDNYDLEYAPYVDSLKGLKKIADIRRKRRVSNGAIEFRGIEAKIIVDEHNVPIDIIKVVQKSGNKLIEDLMLLANETVTRAADLKMAPFIYRVHGEPNKEKTEKLIAFLQKRGLNIKKLQDYNRQFQNIVDEINRKSSGEEAEVLNQLAIRSNAKAIYSSKNIGHFGLALEQYCHFTSPIRRYPDLMVHRILKALVLTVPTSMEIEKYANMVERMAMHCSDKEKDADNCERDADKRKKAEYMENNYIDAEFNGVISSVQQYGVFVTLPNTIEGLISIEDLPNDRYEYDKDTETLYGVRSGRKYQYGDKVKIRVLNASKETSMIDFKLLEEKKVYDRNESIKPSKQNYRNEPKKKKRKKTC